jgi:DNA repair exonuclease SbcCD ATPase subunit
MSSGIAKPRSRKSSKPVKTWKERCAELADSISVEGNIAMVACSECVNNGVVCYYDREQSVKCAECLRHQRNCDGTFSLEDFRKVGEQKKQLQSKSRLKRREIQRLRKVLLEAQSALNEAEEQDSDLQESLAQLEQKSSDMLKREMQALGVFNSVGIEQEVALSDPGFVWSDVPHTETVDVDWDAIWGTSGGTPSQVQG